MSNPYARAGFGGTTLRLSRPRMSKIICTINGEDYTDDVYFTPTGRASNSGYYRMGEPTWWARIGDVFLDIGQVRADRDLDIDPEQIVELMVATLEVTLAVGYGPRTHRDAHRYSYTVRLPKYETDPGTADALVALMPTKP